MTFHIVADQGKNAVYFELGAASDSPTIDGVIMPFRR